VYLRPRPRRACSSTSRTSCRRAARSRRSGSRRSARASATRSRRELHLPHARVRADGARVLRAAGGGPKWYEYWCNARLDWYVELGIPREMLRLRPTTPTSSATTRRGPVTSSSSSRGDGASSRGSRSAPTSTSTSMRSTPGSGSTTSTRRRTSATCRT
jgi:hypothetical protein